MTESINKSEEIKNVYANFGLAVYTAQCLEHELVNAFIFLDLIPQEMPVIDSLKWQQAVDTFTSKHFENTLGKMIAHLNKITDVPSELSNNLSKALKLRNWLVHDYFRERSEQFLFSEGRNEMILELQQATSLIHEVDEQLSLMLEPLKRRHGFTEDFFAKAYEEMLKKRGLE